MAITTKNWSLLAYTDSVLTDFIVAEGVEGAIIKAMNITNTTTGSIDAKVVVTDSANTKMATILPLSGIPNKASTPWVGGPIVLKPTEKIRVMGAGPGLEFFASGVEE